MASYLLNVGATVSCSHSGSATPQSSNSRVSICGQNIVTINDVYSITGCAMPPPNAGNGPCATATWWAGAARVKAGGQPVLLFDSSATCAPTATPLQVLQTQTRVRGQ